MALFLIELAFVGLFFIVVFFVKLSSAPPALKAAIIGVRIILALSILGAGIYYGKKYLDDINHQEQEAQKKKEVLEKLKISSFIGTWASNRDGLHPELNRILNFYDDSTFTDSQSGMFPSYNSGNYVLYTKEGVGYINLNYTNETKILEVIDISDREVLLHEKGEQFGEVKMIKR